MFICRKRCGNSRLYVPVGAKRVDFTVDDFQGSCQMMGERADLVMLAREYTVLDEFKVDAKLPESFRAPRHDRYFITLPTLCECELLDMSVLERTIVDQLILAPYRDRHEIVSTMIDLQLYDRVWAGGATMASDSLSSDMANVPLPPQLAFIFTVQESRFRQMIRELRFSNVLMRFMTREVSFEKYLETVAEGDQSTFRGPEEEEFGGKFCLIDNDGDASNFDFSSIIIHENGRRKWYEYKFTDDSHHEEFADMMINEVKYYSETPFIISFQSIQEEARRGEKKREHPVDAQFKSVKLDCGLSVAHCWYTTFKITYTPIDWFYFQYNSGGLMVPGVIVIDTCVGVYTILNLDAMQTFSRMQIDGAGATTEANGWLHPSEIDVYPGNRIELFKNFFHTRLWSKSPGSIPESKRIQQITRGESYKEDFDFISNEMLMGMDRDVIMLTSQTSHLGVTGTSFVMPSESSLDAAVKSKLDAISFFTYV